MTTNPAFEFQHPRGDGGKFTEKPRAAQSLTLVPGAGDRVHAALLDWEPDDTVPYPQANDLEKVALVVDAVDNGATTADAIADALDMSPRQGAYYVAAARYLRLVESSKSDLNLTEHSPTSLGAALLDSAPEDRAALMAEMVHRLPDAEYLREPGGEAALAKELTRDGMEQVTAERRVDSLRSWVAAADDVTGFGDAISGAYAQAHSRFAGARARAEAQRAEARAAATPVRRDVICDSCFMALPATGVCDSCD